ncbi:MAG: type II toxin-antitoxin system prevent-host-death family antitoxin [Actinobacteria bacterium]|nr:type II toxin-antitoxin system prevent-host-death family antitoxin [Actinomycetota bacterium]
MADVSVSEARAILPQLLDRVLAGEEVTITRHGQPIAVVVRPDALRARRADRALATAATVQQLLAEGRKTPLPTTGGLDERRAEELVGDVRASRSRR